MRRSAFVLAIAAAAIGCSSGNKSPAGDPTPGDPNVATVTFGAAFPGSGAKSLIDARTTEIAVDVFTDPVGLVTSISLTPTSPQATVRMAPRQYRFEASALDSGGFTIERAGTAGKVIAGPNSVVITFLKGQWTFATPVTLSNGWILDRFFLAYDFDAGGGPTAFEPNVQRLTTSYIINYDLDDGDGGLLGESRLRAVTQFGGSTVNRSTFDGGGFNLTQRCGESYDDPAYATACPDQGAPADRWIRIIGEPMSDDCGDCSPGDRAVRRLAPPSSFDPDIRPAANTRIVSGTQIAGTFIEYQFVAGTDELLEGLTGPLPAPPPPTSSVTPDGEFAVTVTEYRMVVACRDGFNSTLPDSSIDHGQWHLGRPGPDNDGDGEPDYYEEGWPEGAVGECNWGLTPADDDHGEWCDGSWDGVTCNTTGGDNVATAWEFVDQDGDGSIDLGSFFLSHLKKQQFQVAGESHSFVATGSAAGGSSVLIQ